MELLSSRIMISFHNPVITPENAAFNGLTPFSHLEHPCCLLQIYFSVNHDSVY